MVGRVFLGKYKTLRLLDEGGMSKIYLARQTNPDREVVVKVLDEAQLRQPKVCEHFRREIHITSRFQHPFAVQFYEGDPKTPLGPVLVLEYLRGVDLNILLHREKRFTPERTGRLLAQLCSVLQAAHDAGVVHRDVKPGNLMIQYPGTPLEQLKLMDFGLATMSSLLYISPEEVFDCTLPPASGTPEYIAPEQVRGQALDHRGDLYSVGVLLFEMLTGQRPFAGATVKELLLAHADQPPPKFAELGLANQLPPALEQLVRDCLAKHPEQRPASADVLLRRYESAVGRQFPLPRWASGNRADASAAPNITQTPAPTKPLKPADDPQAIERHMEVNMPESMAMLKLKGFIHNLGGEIVESVPGLIRVRLTERRDEKKPYLSGWTMPGRKTALQTAPPAAHIELHMRRLHPGQPGRLTVTLLMQSSSSAANPEWRRRCDGISRDLQAYLMGR
jgi:eukaryotic-like serine/threonine-protein kinase